MIQSKNKKQTTSGEIQKKQREFKVLTSAEYRKLYFNSQKDSKQTSLIDSESIYQSLLYYQRLIKLLQALSHQEACQTKIYTMRVVFDKLKTFSSRFFQRELENQQTQTIRPLLLQGFQGQQLSKIIENKVLQEQAQQYQFLDCLKEQIYQEQMVQSKAIFSLHAIIKSKLVQRLSISFEKIAQKVRSISTKQKYLKKIILISNFVIKANKILFKNRLNLEFAFRRIILTTCENYKSNISSKNRAKILFGLKNYPKQKLRSALWNWYLNTTQKSEMIFQKAADRLVLYTNINKTTFFYRLFCQIKGKKRIIDAKTKRMAMFLNLYTNSLYKQQTKTFFQKLKLNKKKTELQLSQKILYFAQNKQLNMINLWNKITKKSAIKQKLLEKILLNNQNCKNKFYFGKWKQLTNQTKVMQICKQTEQFFIKTNFIMKDISKYALDITQGQKIKQNILNLLFLNLSQQMKNTFDKWRLINTIYKLRHCGCNQKQSVIKVLTRQLIKLQKDKKKFVIQQFKLNRNVLIITKDLLKKFISSKGRLVQISFKKMQDLPQRKQKQIILRTYLKRWIFHNNFQKLKEESLNLKKQKYLNKLLIQLKIIQKIKILKAIQKFKSNSLIIGIIRNYFKKVLMAKVGLVIVAFKKIMYLPCCACGSRDAHEKYKKKMTLNKLINRTINSFITVPLNAFIHQLTQARKFKNKSLIKLLYNQDNKTKQLFERWIKLVQQEKVTKRSLKMLSVFEIINNLIQQCKQKQNKFNFWFSRAANKFALNSKVNVQKSFWRLQQAIIQNQNLQEEEKQKKINRG